MDKFTNRSKKGWEYRRLKMPDKFWVKVNRAGPDECWNWLATLGDRGYGVFSFNKRQMAAHRVAFQLSKGAIKKGFCVCHKCDNRKCCNPSHLFQGTDKDNMDDCISKGRRASFRGTKNGRSKLTEKDIMEIRSMRLNGLNFEAIGRVKNITSTTAWHICSGRTWSHV